MTEQHPSTATAPPRRSMLIRRKHHRNGVELAAARFVLREVIRLADQAPMLTEEQLRFRLLTLSRGSSMYPEVADHSAALFI